MKTYKTEMNDIKKSFGMISETKIARDCGMLIERIITGNIFPNFHIYLKTPEERKFWEKLKREHPKQDPLELTTIIPLGS